MSIVTRTTTRAIGLDYEYIPYDPNGDWEETATTVSCSMAVDLSDAGKGNLSQIESLAQQAENLAAIARCYLDYSVGEPYLITIFTLDNLPFYEGDTPAKRWLIEPIQWIFDYFGLDLEKRILGSLETGWYWTYREKLNIVTTYSNAEISCLLGVGDTNYQQKHYFTQMIEDSVAAWKEENTKYDDKLCYPKAPDTLKSIQGRLVGDLHIPGVGTGCFRDTQHYSGDKYKSVAALAKMVGLSKGDVDFSQMNALEWLRHDPDKFLSYNAKDAIISLAGYLELQSNFDGLWGDLDDKGLVKPDEKVLDRIKWSKFTSPGRGEEILNAYLKAQGYKSHWELQSQTLRDDYIPTSHQRARGGLNKLFVKSPSIYESTSQWDIKSAYPCALKYKFPKWMPSRVGELGWMPWEKLARRVKDNLYCSYYVLSYDLPKGISEWGKAILGKSNDGEIGNNYRILREQTCYGIEIITQWLLLKREGYDTKNLKVYVHYGFEWSKGDKKLDIKNQDKNGNYKPLPKGKQYFDLSPLIDKLFDLKEEYGRLGDKNRREVVKLVLNGGLYGKIVQNTSVRTDFYFQSLKEGGKLSEVSHDRQSLSKVSHEVFGGFITAQVRALQSLMAWHTGALQSVTDSLLVDSSVASIDPGEIARENGYPNKLISIFDNFRYEREHEDCKAWIFKERDYILEYNQKPSEGKPYAKVAKLACHAPKDELFKNKEDRMGKGFAEYEETTLTKPDQWLGDSTGTLRLNQPITMDKKLNNDNLRYDCDTTYEHKKRKKTQDYCKKHGFAGISHAMKADPDFLAKARRWAETNTSKPHRKLEFSLYERRLIAFMYCMPHIANTKLAAMFDVHRSTVRRWARDILDSGIPDIVWSGFVDIDGLDVDNQVDKDNAKKITGHYNDPLKWLADRFGYNHKKDLPIYREDLGVNSEDLGMVFDMRWIDHYKQALDPNHKKTWAELEQEFESQLEEIRQWYREEGETPPRDKDKSPSGTGDYQAEASPSTGDVRVEATGF